MAAARLARSGAAHVARRRRAGAPRGGARRGHSAVGRRGLATRRGGRGGAADVAAPRRAVVCGRGGARSSSALTEPLSAAWGGSRRPGADGGHGQLLLARSAGGPSRRGAGASDAAVAAVTTHRLRLSAAASALKRWQLSAKRVRAPRGKQICARARLPAGLSSGLAVGSPIAAAPTRFLTVPVPRAEPYPAGSDGATALGLAVAAAVTAAALAVPLPVRGDATPGPSVVTRCDRRRSLTILTEPWAGRCGTAVRTYY